LLLGLDSLDAFGFCAGIGFESTFQILDRVLQSFPFDFDLVLESGGKSVVDGGGVLRLVLIPRGIAESIGRDESSNVAMKVGHFSGSLVILHPVSDYQPHKTYR
jgi:hypothetical protein